MNFNQFKEAVIAQAQAMGIAEYELYYQAEESTSVSAFQHALNEFSSSESGGVCFRAIVGGKMGYASTENLSAEEARAIVLRAADNASVLESEEQVFLGEGGKTYRELKLTPYALPHTDDLIAAVLDTQNKLYAVSPSVIDGTSTEGLSQRYEIAIYNSKGLDLHYENNMAGLISAAVVTDGKEMDNDYQIRLGALDAIDTDALAKKAVEGALRKLGGEVPASGQCPVIFNPDAMADLLGTFSGIFSSEAAQKGLSKLGDREGQVIASPAVTLIDDPFHPETPVPIHFDAEGSPTETKNVVEKGVLRTLLYNLKTAAAAGKKTTGNASKAGYDSPVAIRPFSMYLKGGDKTEEQLLQQAGNGVYITSLGGLHAGANPITGDFSLQSAGFLIENGEKTKSIKSFTVAGNFYELLKNVVEVADNSHLPMALGMTNFGSGSVLVSGLTVAGR